MSDRNPATVDVSPEALRKDGHYLHEMSVTTETPGIDLVAQKLFLVADRVERPYIYKEAYTEEQAAILAAYETDKAEFDRHTTSSREVIEGWGKRLVTARQDTIKECIEYLSTHEQQAAAEALHNVLKRKKKKS